MLMTMLQAAVVSMAVGQAPSVALIAVANECRPDPTRALIESFRADFRAVGNGVQVLSEEDSANPLGGRCEMTEPAIRELYQQALAALDAAQPDPDLIPRLDRALTQVRRLPPSTARWELERDVTILMAKALWKAGRRLEAQATISPLLMVDKQFRVTDPSPAGFARFVDGIRAALKWTAQLMVTTTPRAKAIIVNGRPFDPSEMPLSVQPGNTYVLEADFGSGRGLVRSENVGEGRTEVELERRFEGSVRPDAGPCVEMSSNDGAFAIVSRLAARLGVRAVVTISPREPIMATYIDIPTKKALRRAELRPGGSRRALVDFVLNGNEDAAAVKALEGGLDAAAARERGARAAERLHWEEAERWYFRALELEPENAESMGALGSVVLQRGELKRAQPILDEAYRRNPKLAKVAFDLGIAYERLHLPAKAVSAFQHYVDLAPDDPEGQYELGLNLEDLDEELALRHLESYVKRENRTTYEQRKKVVQMKIDRLRADLDAKDVGDKLASQLLKQHEEAEKKCEDALALDAHSEAAKGCLAQIQKWKAERVVKDVADGRAAAENKKYANAAALFKEALKLNPHSVEALSSWGGMLLAQGKYADAKAKYEEALDLDGGDPESIQGLDKAKAALAQANAQGPRDSTTDPRAGASDQPPTVEARARPTPPAENPRRAFSFHSGEAADGGIAGIEGGIPGLLLSYRYGFGGYFDIGARVSLNYFHELGGNPSPGGNAEALLRLCFVKSSSTNPWSLGVQAGVGAFGYVSGGSGTVVPVALQAGLHLGNVLILSGEIGLPAYFSEANPTKVAPSLGAGIDLFVTPSFALMATGQLTMAGPQATAGITFRL